MPPSSLECVDDEQLGRPLYFYDTRDLLSCRVSVKVHLPFPERT